MRFKIIFGFVFLLVLFSFYTARNSTPRLRLCTWSNYFSDEVLAEFTKRTGIPIELSLMSSNEELLSKLRAGASGYDIIQPSDYMVHQMAKLGLLQKLNASKLKNRRNLDKRSLALPYDPGLQYSIPFTSGTTGIAIRTDRFSPKGPPSWSWLLQSPLPRETSLLDDMREVFSAGLALQGYSIQERSPEVLSQIRNLLIGVKDKVLAFTSEPKALLLKGEVSIAHIYSCDGLQAEKEDPRIKYYLPKEGAVEWTDNFAIPIRAEHSEMAHQFIDYILEPEVGAAIATERFLATPNAIAKKRLPMDQRENLVLYPNPQKQNLKFLLDLGDSLVLLSRFWTELKSS